MSAFFSFSYLSCCYLCLLVVLALFHLCFSTQTLDDILCLGDERQALLKFKHGLTDDTGRLASWVGGESDCCKWAGIVCDNSTGHVHQIHLRALEGRCHGDDYETDTEYEEASKQRLGGDINPSLLDLKQLNHLDLSCNDFVGIQVPKFIGSLGNLRYLNLSRSNFGGIIPPQLGNLSELHVLCLGSFHHTKFAPTESTRLMNMQWLSSLHILRHLDMSGVDLSNAIEWLQVIDTLPSLDQLHLSYCQLSNISPHVPSLNLTSLSLLDVSGNRFDISVPRWIFSITSLVSLDLNYCNFHVDAIPSSIGFRNLTSLELLHVSTNDFMNSSSVLKELSSSNLISLGIRDCGVSSSVLDSLHNLTSLLTIDLSNNQLTKKIPLKSLGNVCNLREIDLSGNDFSNISLSVLLESFFECKSPALQSLSLRDSGVFGHLPNQLGQLRHLEHLQLPRNYIAGTIPGSVGQLSYLRTIHLHHNHISGPIPYSMGQLSSLEMLLLYNNQVNGCLPESIGRLSLLEKLDLSVNRVDGNLPDSIEGLSSLVVLDLSENQLHGSLPDSIGKLSSLKELRLRSNQLNGSLPESIGQLSSLKVLYLHSNQLNGNLPSSLGQLSKLNILSFADNLLAGVVTETHFAKLVSLRYLHGSGNNLTLQVANWTPSFQLEHLSLNSWVLGPQFPLWLHSQRYLRELDISNTCIFSTMPHESFWRSLPNLHYLDMSQNHIQGSLLGTPSTLGFIDLSFNNFTGNLHHFLCSSGGNVAEALLLGNNHFSGVIPECWEEWLFLGTLNLEKNNMFGEIPTTLGYLTGLQVLNMHGNKISGRLPTSLMNLTNLVILQLGRNELVGSIPAWIGTKLSSLRILNLRSNYFDGYIPHELCNLTVIQILDLAHNNLLGNIPRCFNNFNVLSGKENSSYDDFSSVGGTGRVMADDSLVMKGREDIYGELLSLVMLLDLSSNNFSGQIPSELMNLHKLKSLNLSRNRLTGRMPETMGNMKSLESFDLSVNKLSGELPMSLSSLNFLSSFNVSYNNLTGRVPTSTQLQSFNESSFFGNKLCGAPLTKSCAVEVPNRKDTRREEDESHGRDWGLIISIILGFVSGFWIIMAPLIVSRSWRTAYFRFLNKLGYMVYDVIYKYCFNMFSE